MKEIMSWLPKPVLSSIPESEVMENKGLREQVSNVSSLDTLAAPLALMPDAHSGFGMPIGGVALLQEAISPNMVGVDIGCGMLAIQTDISKEWLLKHRDKFADRILCNIPVGVGGNYSTNKYSWHRSNNNFLGLDVEFAKSQMGTLGSGNHFIELGYDDEDKVWVTVHSGSRRLGQVVAKHYHALAVEDCANAKIKLPHSELAYLIKGTQNYEDYLNDMNEAVYYAELNREVMAYAILDILNTSPVRIISSIHNFAEEDGERRVLHRKGATPAGKGDSVVVPMNMGDGIVIGIGLGSNLSYASCSHGAGRIMGRAEAKRTLNASDQEDYLFERDVRVYTKNGVSVLDEMPGAYKDWKEVMSRQSDLVEIDFIIHSCATIKG
jgi:tRNA-splicing ligase RtcB